ncbi:MAG: hypothetical protein IH585_20405 [Anaerolineaceae bacterium]|nr:hypothetical protein [Anaerolineaceae bacterium]
MNTVGKAKKKVGNEYEDNVAKQRLSLEDVFKAEGGFVPEITLACQSIRGLNGRWDVDE